MTSRKIGRFVLLMVYNAATAKVLDSEELPEEEYYLIDKSHNYGVFMTDTATYSGSACINLITAGAA